MPDGSVLPVAVTMGDPAGIGGEITVSSYQMRANAGLPAFYVVDAPDRLARIADARINIEVIGSPEEAIEAFKKGLPVLPPSVNLQAAPVAGRPSSANAGAVIASIEDAVSHALSGKAAGVATNPISKAVLYEAGFRFPGHTEFLGELSKGYGQGANRPVMMLASPILRVVPVTVHIPLCDVPKTLTPPLLEQTIRIVHAALIGDFAIEKPRIAVSGLNPHAGEDGKMGREEVEIIEPVLKFLRAEGMVVDGPIPADALFTERWRRNFDVAVCMYHDQALVPIKALDFDRAVNVTLGLPFVRTSPDHGTAFDIAGKGIADPSSLIEAIRMADTMGKGRRRTGANRNG